VGRKGGAQGGLCAPLATPNDKEERLWRLFHLQEYTGEVRNLDAERGNWFGQSRQQSYL
jgi:hypothetical protein